MRIIVGLGNPGKKYDTTRHNIGFAVVDEIARQHGLEWKLNKKFNAEVANYGDTLLVKPLTFMNDSGKSVSVILRFYNLIPKSLFGIKKNADLRDVLTIVQDELDIPFGKYKVSTDSSAAGHNGVQSIIDHIKTQNFKRLRIGIDVEGRRVMPSNAFVLQPFTQEEKQVLQQLIPNLAKNLI